MSRRFTDFCRRIAENKWIRRFTDFRRRITESNWFRRCMDILLWGFVGYFVWNFIYAVYYFHTNSDMPLGEAISLIFQVVMCFPEYSISVGSVIVGIIAGILWYFHRKKRNAEAAAEAEKKEKPAGPSAAEAEEKEKPAEPPAPALRESA